ncbi:hypothetical protein SAMN05421678_114159 [Actinopolymorpha cephalotaxi]|uniref:Uncharacterized protein n=1 Tax=Actinopolymorpha cephalotaxi TaxID=504797 RepID=A0A1I2YL56_9ACTN|nr:hypothetical protein [Actinopolymorpha cephalotaxi]NYH86907.1 hypothetical protein [Actinopolymorpha cephalotaxi]SFH26343.1 hypothetical protein SAMN05421678_114159 [Actinopolymorpha cephalotaxi]
MDAVKDQSTEDDRPLEWVSGRPVTRRKIGNERHPVSDLLFVGLTIIAFCVVVGVLKAAAKL